MFSSLVTNPNSRIPVPWEPCDSQGNGAGGCRSPIHATRSCRRKFFRMTRLIAKSVALSSNSPAAIMPDCARPEATRPPPSITCQTRNPLAVRIESGREWSVHSGRRRLSTREGQRPDERRGGDKVLLCRVGHDCAFFSRDCTTCPDRSVEMRLSEFCKIPSPLSGSCKELTAKTAANHSRWQWRSLGRP